MKLLQCNSVDFVEIRGFAGDSMYVKKCTIFYKKMFDYIVYKGILYL